ADLPEIPRPGEAPQTFAERMAREKARAVARRHRSSDDRVLAADTVVVVDGQILGKPTDAADAVAEAVRMLRLISGREHQVVTGVCLIDDGQPRAGAVDDVRSETTRVWVNEISEDEIRDYVSSGEPMDKAGAYA